MGSIAAHGRTLHAALCEVERGLFSVRYRAGEMDHNVHYLPPYQVGSCAADARQRIEQAALRYGYEAIIWDPVFPAPEHPLDPIGPLDPATGKIALPANL